MKRPNTKQRLIGYARVSTAEQATEAQEMELRSAGASHYSLLRQICQKQ